MTLEVILLGLASTVRPTSMAAVCALLATAAPRRLMVVYVCAGLAFTIAVGVIVVLALSGIDIQRGGHTPRESPRSWAGRSCCCSRR